MKTLSNFKNRFYLLAIFGALSLVYSCKKENQEEPMTISQEAYDVNLFVKNNMNDYYLWSNKIDNSIDIKKEADPIAYFDKILYKGTSANFDVDKGYNLDADRWSFITDDLQGLIDYYNGQRTSAGMYMYSYRYDQTSNRLALVVAYTFSNSPAGLANLKRGDIIAKINGQEINENNVNQLLSNNSYSVTLADLVNGQFVDRSTSINITKAQYDINPIMRSEIYDINGKKVAYLLYHSFIHENDLELIALFESYKSQNVSELILDLRYNGGGSVATANNLASMIAPSSAIGKIFSKKQFNEALQDYLLTNPNYGRSYLEDKLSSTAFGYADDPVQIAGTPLPNLNLSRLYVIGQENTASASELIINGLRPYMNVVLVGENTHGKYTASITIENETHTNWAIQPIVYKSSNSLGVSDYWAGLTPDISAIDLPHLGDFGYDVASGTGESMLSIAINDIKGAVAKMPMPESMLKNKALIRVMEMQEKKDMIDNLNFSLPLK